MKKFISALTAFFMTFVLSVCAAAEDAAEAVAQSFTIEELAVKAGTAFLLGLVIALIVCLMMRSNMKTAVKKSTANDYIKKNSFSVTRSRDILVYSNISKKKREQEGNKR